MFDEIDVDPRQPFSIFRNVVYREGVITSSRLSLCRACSQTPYNGAWQIAVCTVDDVQSMTASESTLAIAVAVGTASYHYVMLGDR